MAEVKFLKSYMDGAARTRNDATSSAKEQVWESKMLESCICLLKNVLDLLKGSGSTGCDMEDVSRKVADTKGEVNSFVDGLHRVSFLSYASI